MQQFGNAGHGTGNTGCFQRHEDQLAVVPLTNLLQGFNVFHAQKVLQSLNISFANRLRDNAGGLGFGECFTLSCFGIEESSFFFTLGL